mgnify:CR=1 FL=1
METLIHRLQEFVWGPGMVFFFLATGIRFTLSSGFFQIRKIHIWMGKTLGALKKKEVRRAGEEQSISQFQSFCTALGATLGTGNITGVATALVFGGPGAIFWMWVSAFFGMMTNYAENFLGIKYRYRDKEGRWRGGAMVYMERGLGSRPLALVFAVSYAIYWKTKDPRFRLYLSDAYVHVGLGIIVVNFLVKNYLLAAKGIDILEQLPGW